MTPCAACLHYPHCMERRGICTEYKTLEMIRREINALNENNTASAAGPVPTDITRQRKPNRND